MTRLPELFTTLPAVFAGSYDPVRHAWAPTRELSTLDASVVTAVVLPALDARNAASVAPDAGAPPAVAAPSPGVTEAAPAEAAPRPTRSRGHRGRRLDPASAPPTAGEGDDFRVR